MVFRLDLGQIGFNLAENAFATQQLAFLATSIGFYHIVTRACAESGAIIGDGDRKRALFLVLGLAP